MAGLNRRDFLRALGLTSGTAVASACGLDDNIYRQPIEHLLPYVVQPEQVVPGTPTFFATTVRSGPNAFPQLARHRDGRVINVGANPRSPLAPAVPRESLFELQKHYSPDRFQAPREGDQALGWDDALSRLADAVRASRAAGRKVAWLGGYRSGAIVELIRDFTEGEAIFWEPLGLEAEVKAAEALFGERVVPAYDLSQARYVLSFGADFLGTWGNRKLAADYADARNPNIDGFITRLALVSPHMGQSGGNADDWYAARSGSEALVARAVARLVADQVGYQGPLRALIDDADVDAAAQAAELSRADLEAMAANFAAGPAVALPGGAVGASRAATDLALATYVLNLVAGHGGVTFGLGPVYEGPVDGTERLEALVAEMRAGRVGVLLIDDLDAAYALPANTGFAEALAEVGLVVGLCSHPNATNASAGLILPVSDAFEDWGDEEPFAGLHLLRQPSMSPLYDTRSLGDILLVTARSVGIEVPGAVDENGEDGENGEAVGGSLGFAHENWREYLRARWRRDLFPVAGADGEDFEAFWHRSLVDGLAQVPTPLQAPEPGQVDWTFGPAAVPEGEGHFLVAYPHPFLHDGRYANQPWAQEVPEPMTGNVWNSWVEIHPTTAADLGLARNNLVTLTTEAGEIQVPVHVYKGVRPDTVAVAFGQGNRAGGRYAQNIGENVVRLLGMVRDPAGAMAWQQTRVRLQGTRERGNLHTTFGSETDQHRKIGVVAPATELAAVGDAPHEHPGELTGIHPFEMDARLEARGIREFYPPPDRPVYRFAMTIDINACNGCGTCAIACYAENNLPVVGRAKAAEGREMGWLRVNRYWGYDEDEKGPKEVRFLPMLCQHCGKAPCESVCPVLATYHTIDGLNAMIYNRCVGTRYCSNNCPYKVRRFNWHSYVWPEPFNLQLNPEVVTRTMGVMEKCTFCVQRTRDVRSAYRSQGVHVVPDEALQQLPACAEACPSQAITFGNLNDPESTPTRTRQSGRSYLIFEDLNTQPAINYLARATHNPRSGYYYADGAADAGEQDLNPEAADHGGGDH